MIERYHKIRFLALLQAMINLFMGLLKIVCGWLGASQALLADGVHSLSDLLTDALVFVAAKLSHRDADDKYPYGHGRIETVATIILAGCLILVGGLIVYEQFNNLLAHRVAETPHILAVWIAAVSVVVNEFLYRYMHRIATHVQSSLLHANAWHRRSDGLASLIVLVGLLATQLGLPYMDALAAIVVGVLVVLMGWELAWTGIRELIDAGADPELLEQVKTQIVTVSGVLALHQLRTRLLAGRVFIDVHVLVESHISVSEGHYIGEKVRLTLLNSIDEVEDVIVHVDPEDDNECDACLDLPTHADVVTELKTYFAGLPGVDHSTVSALHYLDHQLEVVMMLPCTVLQSIADIPQIQTAYEQAGKQWRLLRRVKVVFC